MELDQQQEAEGSENRSENGFENMVDMLLLTEESLLKNIQLRFAKQLIYTYSGNILVAVNPYKMFNIYGTDCVKTYEGKAIGDEPAHLFAIGSAAYGKMLDDMENQVIIISGESGAGKTESTKLLMQFLAASCNKTGKSLVTERILEANPLLEAFGNAKTIRNDNSSRFGKYVELFFRGGDIVGAKTTVYLLEKSRIVTQSPDERNYHLFYELLGGLHESEKSQLGLTSARDFAYLVHSESMVLSTKNDSNDFQEVLSAFDLLGFTSEDISTIYKIMSCILHLGNITFRKVPNTYQNEGVRIENDDLLLTICRLLELPVEGLREALTTKVTEARNERLITPLATDQALDTRDALSKALYQRLFTWLVQRVNDVVKCENLRRDLTSIAILDIFGFEDFRENSFEQLCINYANESLQYYFNEHIFRIEQAEYEKEQVTWVMIDFHDNRPVADLISRKPNGILQILDDESSFPSGTDKSFLEKCHQIHSLDPSYVKPRMSGMGFCIKHYAGDVTYNATHFLDKNRDTLRTDLVQLLIQSTNRLISKMFQELYDAIVSKLLVKTTAVYSAAKPRTSTVAASFNEELQSLIVTMTKCNPWFVRCIKPNGSKAPMAFEPEIVLKQLHYTGMLETVKIRKLGFPVRHRFGTFAQRYSMLLNKDGEMSKCNGDTIMSGENRTGENRPAEEDYRKLCEEILDSLPPSWIHSWQIGMTKLFLKELLANHLDRQLDRFKLDAVVTLQKYVRCYINQKKYQRMLSAVRFMQIELRAWKSRRRYAEFQRTVVLVQSHARMLLQKRAYEKLKFEKKKQEWEEKRQRQNHELEERKRQKDAENARKNAEIARKNAEITRARDEELRRKEVLQRARGETEKREQNGVNDYFKRPDSRKFFGNRDDVRMSDYGGNFYLRKEPWNPDRSNLHKGAVSDDNFRSRKQPLRVEGSRPLRYRSAEALDTSGEARLFNWAPIPRIGNRAAVFEHYSASDIPVQDSYPVGCYVYQAEDAMEIPEELAFIFSKMDGWQRMHTEKDIRSVDDVAVGNGIFTLPSDINSYVFSKYANTYCKDTLTGLHNAPIKKPFLPKSDDQEVRTTLSIFKLILRHLIESNVTRDQDLMIARYIVQKGLEHAYLRDEILLLIFSQTLENNNVNHLRKAWVLMTLCLSCFRPSEVLTNYLLKYVSDNAYDGYRALCQRKMLESEMVEREISRVYPPSILELAATEERKRMALQAVFCDGYRLHGEVDSWTTGEKFASNLLERRNISGQDSHGWTVMLREGAGCYECAGYDFVLDLISEMEIPPGFPFVRSHHLVYSDKTRTSGRRIHIKDMAHDPERPRIMNLDVSELSEPILLTSADALLHESNSPSNSRSYVTYSDFASPNNVLNRRVDVNMENGPSPTSVMNVRYMKRTDHDVEADAPLNAFDTHLFSQRKDSTEAMRFEPADVQQKQNVVQAPQGKFPRNAGLGSPQSLPWNHHSKEMIERQRKSGHKRDASDYQISDMDRWLESVFEQALDGTVDDLDDEFLLTTKIKGGIKDEENKDLQTENISLQAQLEEQPSQNQILQEDLQAELQKHQKNEPTSDSNSLSPSSSAGPFTQNSTNIRVASPPPAAEAGVGASASTPDQQYSVIWPNASETAGVGSRFVTDSEIGHDGGKVRFETKVLEHSDQPANDGPSSTALNRNHVPLRSEVSSDSTSTQSLNYTPMLPTSSYSAPPNIPIPPPPPPLPPSIRNLKPGIHPVTIRDRRGVERPIRVGKIQWPPPQEEVKKQEIEVGRLLIEETKDDPNIPKRSTEEIRQKISDRILAAQQMAAQETAAQELTKTTAKPFANKEFPKKPPVPLPDRAKPPMAKAIENTNKIAVDVKRRQEELRLQFENTPRQPLVVHSPTTVDEAVQTTNSLSQKAKEGVAVHPVPLSPSIIVKPHPQMNIPVDTVDTGHIKETKKAFDADSVEPVQTVLHPLSTGSFLTYNTDSWTVCVRKEIFLPNERTLHPLLIDLIFRQIVDDVYSNACIRVGREDKAAMRAVLDDFGKNTSHLHGNLENESGKVSVIETAKNWPFYFSRIFAVSGGMRLPSVQLLGISHSAVRLLSRQKTPADDVLGVVETIRFQDIADVSVPKMKTLQIHYANRYVFLYTFRANEIKKLIDAFCAEAEREMPSYVKAVRDHITREPGRLNFKKGDIIELTNMGSTTERGWLQGSAHGRSGSFPADHVITIPSRLMSVDHSGRSVGQSSGTDGRQDTLKRGFADANNKYCMLDFALLYFREAPYRYEMSQSEEADMSRPTSPQKTHINNGRQEKWTWREQVNMIKWTQNPIEASLLKFDSPNLNQMALDCFINIMRYMNDYPLTKGMEPTDCSLFLLRTSQSHPELTDEIFCQLMKQITNNRSNKPESCLLGWRLLSLFLSYYRCTDLLLPHLRKYLEQNANNTRQPHHAIAAQCLQNLQQTLKYGGRKCMPSKSELSAVMCGRLANQLLCMLPGGVPAKITVKSSTVILDAVNQVCDTLQLKSSLENLEFTMYSIIGPDDYSQLPEKAYLMDEMTKLRSRKKDFFFLCQRTSWIFPLHLDGNLSYINLMYQQNRPDYLDGYLLAVPSKTLPNHAKEDIALLAALQIQAADMQTIPQQKDMEIFIPLNAQRVSNISLSQWTNLVHEYLKNVRQLTPHECQIKYLEILSRWPKFGSTFFPIKSVSDDRIRGGSCLLAVNHQGLHFCSSKTYETLMFFSFRELLSARHRAQRSGAQFLDLKCGSLMQHKVLALQTDKAEDLGLLIDQYIHVHQAKTKQIKQKESR